MSDTHTTPAQSVSGLDLVPVLVDEAVRLFRESLDVEASARDRRVDPRKSPQVAQAHQRFMGACELLSAMWLKLGMDPSRMNPARAQHVVAEMHLRRALLAAVRTHAQEHYNQGWDVIVEAYTDEELCELFGAARTPEDAIRAVGEVVELLEENRKNHLPIAGWPY